MTGEGVTALARSRVAACREARDDEARAIALDEKGDPEGDPAPDYNPALVPRVSRKGTRRR